MRREVSISIFAVLIVAAAILTVYYLNVGPTGFAVFEQNTQVAFDEGAYSNVEYDVNDSTIILSANQTSGTYTSKIFNANESVIWNNLTWQGQGNLSFEVRSCSTSDCSDFNFTTADLNNLNLSSQYFQYKVLFVQDANLTTSLRSVSLDYSSIAQPQAPLNVTITLFQPSGTLTSRAGVPVQFVATGSNIQCWYNLKDSSEAEVIANTTLSGCANSTFSVSGDGDYVLTLYANGSSGSASQSSSFLVSTPAEKSSEKEEELPPEEPLPTEAPPEQQIQSVTDLSLQSIETSTLSPSDSKDFNLIVKDIGTEPVSGCKISVSGDSASWVSIPDDSKNFNPGDEKSFSFSVSVPEDTAEANYVIPITVQCAEVLKSSEFTVQVVKKRFTFSLTGVQRTREDRVRVTYSLAELLNEEQTVQLEFLLFDAANQQVANTSQNQTLAAGESDEFRTNIPVNESLEGNLTLTVDLNSEQYFSSVREPITLGAPIGGFVIFGEGGVGTGGIIILVVVVLILVAVFFLARRMRQSGKTLADLLKVSGKKT